MSTEQIETLKKEIKALAGKGGFKEIGELFEKSKQLSELGVGVLIENKKVTFMETK